MEEDDGGDGAGESEDEGVEVCGHTLGFVGETGVDVPCYELDGGREAGGKGRGGGYGLPFGAGEGLVGLGSFWVGVFASW